MSPPSYAERMYDHAAHKLAWVVPLLLVIGGYSVFSLVRAAQGGPIYRRGEPQQYVYLATNPDAFWSSVAQHILGVLIAVGLLAMIAAGRHASRRRAAASPAAPPAES